MITTSSARTNQTLVLSGSWELAVGALIGWPYALAVNHPDRIGALGIQSVPRLRQWHLDLIALGGLSVLVGSAVPDLPRRRCRVPRPRRYGHRRDRQRRVGTEDHPQSPPPRGAQPRRLSQAGR
jgi:hypothetical protein